MKIEKNSREEERDYALGTPGELLARVGRKSTVGPALNNSSEMLLLGT